MLKFISGLTALLLAGSLPQLSGAQDHETAGSGASIEWKSAAPDQLCDYCEDYRLKAAVDPADSAAEVRAGDAKENGSGSPGIVLTTR